MEKLKSLLEEVKKAEEVLAEKNAAVDLFKKSPENNVFETMDDAEEMLEDRLRDEAHQDCEGSYNCGEDEYKQEFIVDGKHYIAKLKVEYNRHDKTYYYVDGTEFSVEPVDFSNK